MPNTPDRQEPQYITDQQPNAHHVPPDVAQDPDELALKSLPQVPKGQETEPTKRVTDHAVGKSRRKTIGLITQGEKILKAQDPFRVDVTLFENEATGQKEFETTAGVQNQFQQTGVRPSDYQEISIQNAERIDPSEVSGRQLSTVRKQKGGASLKNSPINNQSSRILASKARP